MKQIIELKYMTTYKIEVDCDIYSTKKMLDEEIKYKNKLIKEAIKKVENGGAKGITEPWSNTMYQVK